MIMEDPKKRNYTDALSKEQASEIRDGSSLGGRRWSLEDHQLHHQNLGFLNLSHPRVPARFLKSKSRENPKGTVTQDNFLSIHRQETSSQNTLSMPLATGAE